MAVKRGEPGADAARAARAPGAGPARPTCTYRARGLPARSDVAADNPVPTPPFWGDRDRQGHRRWPTRRLPRRARDVHGAVGAQAARGERRAVVRGAGRDRGPAAAAELAGPDPDRGMLEAAVVYGYFPCGRGRRPRRARHGDERRAGAPPVHLPAAAPGPAPVPGRLLPAARLAARSTSSRFHLVTMGRAVAEVTAELFERNAYRDYLELHGLSVQLTEALAEYWHARIRAELGFAGEDPETGRTVFEQAYRGPRFSLRLPRLPRPGGPRKGRRTCSTRADRRRALRGVPAAPRAVHRRTGRAPPRGQVLQRQVSAPHLEDAGLGAVGRERPSRRRPAGDPVRRPGREARQPRPAGRSQSTGGRASRPRAALGVEIEDPLRPGPVSSVPAPGGPVELE